MNGFSRNLGQSFLKLSILQLAVLAAVANAQTNQTKDNELEEVHVTAERQLQQSLGVSKIDSVDLEKQPAANDVSDLVRTMPGVNLSGNTATGQRGNKRQIDLRGMGPENTLILIDGKPVTSRNSERISMRGERNTRGDSNWVPVEAIESVEVIRGPAAARYGSGSMGGVVNIVTKKISNEFKGQVNFYTNQPQDSKEGSTTRMGFSVAGPIIKDSLSFRIYGSTNKTNADASDINAAAGAPSVAGVEGVRNKDIAGRLNWKINQDQSISMDAGFSRQGNIYNGDTQNSIIHPAAAALIERLKGSETAKLYRKNFSISHKGKWSWGETESYIAYDHTNNYRLPEYLSGGPEGSYRSSEFTSSKLSNLRASSQAHIPLTWAGVKHVLTVGLEAVKSKLDDPASNTQGFTDQGRTDIFTGISATRSGKRSQKEFAIYVEDNISISQNSRLIPTLRYDHNSNSGGNVSGGLNFSHILGEEWLIKGGIAKAYKAPNLYQTDPNFILYTRGNGCPIGTSGRCYYMGNADLKPETSWNKEIGIEWQRGSWQASATLFHNAYKDKIVIGDVLIAQSDLGNALYQWENTPRATIAGIEGNLVVPIAQNIKWSNNFTYMSKSKDYQGNPLSMTPKHTINSTIAWQINPSWDTNLTFTHFGRIKPRQVAINRTENASGLSTNEIGSYGLFGINAGYKINKQASVRFGISNIFDKKIYRTANGAQTFNQHGRAYYLNLKYDF